MHSSVLQHAPCQPSVEFYIETSIANQLHSKSIDWYQCEMQHWTEMGHAAIHWNTLK